jgi:hypothetical protein
MIDTLRADHLASYGHPHATAPLIESVLETLRSAGLMEQTIVRRRKKNSTNCGHLAT